MLTPSRESGRPVIDLLVGAGLVVGVFVLYGQVGRHDFVRFDDYPYIVDNPFIANGLTWEGFRWAFTSHHLANWHPLTWLSHMADRELFGLRPAGHHLANVFLHAASAATLYAALRLMTRARWPSALVAALFAFHPLRVESVAWAAERKDVLAGLFWMLTLLAYARYAGHPGRLRYAAVVICMAVGLLAKPMLVTLPFVLILLDIWPFSRWRPWPVHEASARPTASPPVHPLVEKLPLLALVAGAAWITVVAQRAGGAVQALEGLSLKFRVANAAIAYAAYVGKTLWPRGLAFYYPHPAIVAAEPLEAMLLPAIVAAMFIVVLTAAVVVSARRRPYLTVGWLWYLGTLIPVIGIVQVGNQAMADRYTYIPLIGIYIMVAWSAADLAARSRRARNVVATVSAIVVAALCVVTWIQVGHWRDSVSLFEHAIRVTRGNYVAHHNLGIVLAEHGSLPAAVEQYESALRIRPDLASAHNNLGIALAAAGDLSRAVTHYREAIRLQPAYEKAHYNLAIALETVGRPVEAQAHYERALEIDLDLAEAHERLGSLLAARGEESEAAAHYRRALELKPELLGAASRLAWLLATSPRPDLRNGTEAVRWAEHAAAAVEYSEAYALNVLAASYAEAGDFERAVRWQEQAVERASPAEREDLRHRLELYRAGAPYRSGPGRAKGDPDGDARASAQR